MRGRAGGGGILPAMSVSLSRALAFLALVPVAGCDLYLRGDSASDDTPDLPDASTVVPDAMDIDAGPPPIDAPPTPPPNPGFVTPTTTTRANAFRNGQWADVGPADWSCLIQPSVETVPAAGYTLGGTVRDFVTNQSIGGASIAASALGQPLGSATAGTGGGTGGTRGVYRMDVAPLPNGATRVRFTVGGMTTRRTISIDRYLGPAAMATLDLPLMSDTAITSFPALVGEAADATAGLVVGELRDCQGRSVSGAIIALSTSSAFVAHWTGGVTYYFSAGNQSLPVRHSQRTETNRDGRFMIINPEPMAGAEGTVQAWGFQTDADRATGALKPLGKLAAVVDSAAVSAVLIGRARG